MRRRIAWAFTVVALAAVLVDTIFTAQHRSLLSEYAWAVHRWPLVTLAGLGCALMGGLVVSRYPAQPLGWLLCVASLIAVTQAADAYSIWALAGRDPDVAHGGHISAWVATLIGWPAFTAMIVIFLFAPDGRLLSPRWRWAAWAAVAGVCLHTAGSLTVPPGEFITGEQYRDRPISGVLIMAGVALVAAGLIASALSLVLRLRRARDDTRRQLLWIATPAALLAIGVVVIIALPSIQQTSAPTLLAALPLSLAYVAFPLCVAVAVLRHRLLDIDLIVNRALVLAFATGLAGAGYVIVVVLTGLAVGGRSDGFWLSLVATALVAMAFQPLRGWVVRVADRMAYGPAAAPYDALADFSRKLGESPDSSALLPAVAAAAARAVGAERATVRLTLDTLDTLDTGPRQSASWPGDRAPAAGATEIEIAHAGEVLGGIAVRMPPGRTLRDRDRRALAGLAEQAGMAVRNVRLSAELSGQVERLAQRNRELTDARRRLITVSDAERRRLEESIAQEVGAHLAPIPARLLALSRSGARPPSGPDRAELEQLIQSSMAALEALREITRSVYPGQLARSGLSVALASLLARTADGLLTVENHSAEGRFGHRAEAAAYYCAAEAVRGLAAPVVLLAVRGDHVQVTVSGDERVPLPIRSMRDRAEAAGGTITQARARARSTVEVRLPVA